MTTHILIIDRDQTENEINKIISSINRFKPLRLNRYTHLLKSRLTPVAIRDQIYTSIGEPLRVFIATLDKDGTAAWGGIPVNKCLDIINTLNN